MIVTSEVTGRQYEKDDTVKIYNQKQYAKYIKHGAMIVDACIDEYGNFYLRFNTNEVQHLFDLWCKHELD